MAGLSRSISGNAGTMTQDGSSTGDGAEREYPQRLDRGAAAVSEDASCVGQWQVDRLRAQAGPGVTDAQARQALARCGVRVAELPGCPPDRRM